MLLFEKLRDSANGPHAPCPPHSPRQLCTLVFGWRGCNPEPLQHLDLAHRSDDHLRLVEVGGLGEQLQSGRLLALHVCDALCQVRPSVSAKELDAFDEWNRLFGSFTKRSTSAPPAVAPRGPGAT